MSRPKGEIKGLRCKRLKEIIEREGVKQNQLSEETYRSNQYPQWCKEKRMLQKQQQRL